MTDSYKALGSEYENRVCDLETVRPFQVLSSEITYARIGEGFDHLCQARAVRMGIVLASHQQERMTKDLILSTIKKAHSH